MVNTTTPLVVAFTNFAYSGSSAQDWMYTATLANGSALPSFIEFIFSSSGGQFTIYTTDNTTAPGTYPIIINAYLPSLETGSGTFTVIIVPLPYSVTVVIVTPTSPTTSTSTTTANKTEEYLLPPTFFSGSLADQTIYTKSYTLYTWPALSNLSSTTVSIKVFLSDG
jgi:hypothetical protein